jgi:hypothetical protein
MYNIDFFCGVLGDLVYCWQRVQNCYWKCCTVHFFWRTVFISSLKNTDLFNTSQRYGLETGRRAQIVAQSLWSGDCYVVYWLVAKPPHHVSLTVLWLVVCYVLMVSLDNGERYKIFKLSLKLSTFISLFLSWRRGKIVKLFCSAIITVICLTMLFSNNKGYRRCGN